MVQDIPDRISASRPQRHVHAFLIAPLGTFRLVVEHVESVDVGVIWNPNAPNAVLASGDSGVTVLAVNAHPDDKDQRCVVLAWSNTRSATMSDPNDEALPGHRLYDRGLASVLWAGMVKDSEVTAQLEERARVHPEHDPVRFASLVHHVVPLKECTVEVVAAALSTNRIGGSTSHAALAQLTE